MDVELWARTVEAENERLRGRVRQLEDALIGVFVPPFEWHLTASEQRVLGVLVMRPMATKDAIMAALYRDDGREEPEQKIVDVFICKLRRKLKPWQVDIQTIWGQGWRLDPEWRARLSQIPEAAVAA